jgi:outer membrane protein OmpA-like peptidoglycan-associated protein
MHPCPFHKAVLYSLFLALPAVVRAQPADTLLVHFNVDRSRLTPQADSLLDRYFSHAKAAADIRKISLRGFCDNTGDDRYNDRLAKSRVMAVRRYLVSGWADTATIRDLRWFGKRFPVDDNGTAEGRAANRRVIVLVFQSAHTPNPATSPSSTSSTAPPAATSPSAAPSSATTPSSSSPPSSTPSSPPPGSRSLTQEIADSNTRAGTKIVLQDVVFFGDRHLPLTNSFVALDELTKAMMDNPRLCIRIEGHVCCLPDSIDGVDFDSGKTDLSLERARYVYDYLLKAGISKDRMFYDGYGAANKLFPAEATPAEQARNRRVEIRIVSK